MKKDQVEREFEKYRESLHLEVQRLASYISLYRHLHERMRDRLNEMNMSPAFFQVTIDALFTAIVLWVDKLFGKNSERGFLNFLSFIENNRKIFSIDELKRRKGYPDGHWMLNREPITFRTIEIDRQRLEQMGSLPHFKLRRDKFHAHFDKEYFFNTSKLAEDAPIKWEDLNHVVDTMADILNTYSAAYDGNVYHIAPSNINDIDRILNLLHEYRTKK